jgi:hypothetical protein
MKALITLLILGTSSVAIARPITVDHRDDAINGGVIVRDHREPLAPDQFSQPAPDYRTTEARPYYGDEYRWQRFRMQPVALATDVSFMRQRNRDHRPMLIDIDSRIGGLKKLRIDRTEGRMYVDSIMIMFADGHRQTVEVDRTLSGRDPSFTIELDHGAVTALTINGQTMRGRATFNVIGLRR